MPETAVAVSSLRLLRTPVPYSGESFLGYLLRLTEENSYDSLRWILELAGLKVYPDQGRWADLWRPHPRLSLLREVTGLSEAEMESLRETLAPGCLVRWKTPKGSVANKPATRPSMLIDWLNSNITGGYSDQIQPIQMATL